ncbi:DUF2065 domain-containing protein [Solimonas sp. SE-A11]|uniref:DUF2065 domain-containing protein n=1 Tax=Solimonas sp. SE-A11 TaxID=3054954 RepID=UPI00259CB588|nr:DUF2065 domain-containing protein [Solimonas sp. SE-A11]
MDWNELLRALALVMVIEGLLPFVAPARWRQMMLSVMQLDSRHIRIIGLGSMLGGVVLLNLL